MYSVPTVPGLYWARIDRSKVDKWTVVELHPQNQKTIRVGETWVECIGWDAGALVPDDCWGPKLEPPDVSKETM